MEGTSAGPIDLQAAKDVAPDPIRGRSRATESSGCNIPIARPELNYRRQAPRGERAPHCRQRRQLHSSNGRDIGGGAPGKIFVININREGEMHFVRTLLTLGALLSIAAPPPAGAQQAKPGPAYFVIELNVKNREVFDRDYGSHVGALVTKHGGTFVVGGRKPESVEGTPPQGVILILRFDSMGIAKAFLNDPEYKKIVPVRHRTADTRSYLVEAPASQ
jgi:uncharacterized protein (DUF1330 family)